MLKKIGLMLSLVLLISACGGKSTTGDEDPTVAIRKALAEYDRDVCGQKAFSGTKKQLMDSDKYVAMGDFPKRDLSNQEVVRMFSKEEPAYKELLHQRKRTDDLNNKMAQMDRDPVNKGSLKWLDTKTMAKEHLKAAKAAEDNCDAKTANKENNKAQELLGAPVANEKAPAPVAEKAPAPVQMNANDYTVVRGDCLWNISKRELKNPYLWPVIYWGNKSEIKDPDLIYPGQVFGIDNKYPTADKKKAIKFARTRGKWSLYDGK